MGIKSKWRAFWSPLPAGSNVPDDSAGSAPDKKVAERLTRYYLAALSVIAILSLAGLWLIDNAIRYHESDSQVLNVSGRQRMLSQKLTKMALLKKSGFGSYNEAEYDSTLYRWQISHEQLEKGILRASENYLVKKSKAVDGKFAGIEPVYRALYEAFIAYGHAGNDAEHQFYLNEILRLEPLFLREMEEIVSLFDVESRKRVGDLRRIEYIMITISLLTLFLEALLVFAPIVRYTKGIIRELSESKEALHLANQKLREANESLFHSQQKVLQLQESRHLQLRMEDQIKAASLMEGQEEERKRLARELHDGVGQMLTGLKLLVGRLKKTPPDAGSYKTRLEEVSVSIQEIIIATRQISHNVMPDTLVDYGLAAALEALVGQVRQAAASELALEIDGTPFRLIPAHEIALYRIAQEALVNALKHARAGIISIVLHFDNDSLTMEIRDNGSGFSAEKILDWQNAGLENMQTRARLIKADFSLDSEPEKGTRILVTLRLG